MKSITRKGEVIAIVGRAIEPYETNGLEACLNIVKKELLESKIKDRTS